MLLSQTAQLVHAAGEQDDTKPGLSVGLLWWPADRADPRYETARSVEACVARAFEREAPDTRLVREQRMREALFPLMEPGTQPVSESSLVDLLQRADVRERLSAIGLRYLVIVGGGKQTEPARGFIACGAGFGAGGCLGYAWQNERTEFHAALWDLSRQALVSHPSAEATGRTVVPAFVLPVPIYARSLESACTLLGQRILEDMRRGVATDD
jgi:hypothetical protein